MKPKSIAIERAFSEDSLRADPDVKDILAKALDTSLLLFLGEGLKAENKAEVALAKGSLESSVAYIASEEFTKNLGSQGFIITEQEKRDWPNFIKRLVRTKPAGKDDEASKADDPRSKRQRKKIDKDGYVYDRVSSSLCLFAKTFVDGGDELEKLIPGKSFDVAFRRLKTFKNSVDCENFSEGLLKDQN